MRACPAWGTARHNKPEEVVKVTSDLKNRQAFAADLARRAGGLGMKYFPQPRHADHRKQGPPGLCVRVRIVRSSCSCAASLPCALSARRRCRPARSTRRPPVPGFHLGHRSDRRQRANFVAVRYRLCAWRIACVEHGVAVVGVIHEPLGRRDLRRPQWGGAFPGTASRSAPARQQACPRCRRRRQLGFSKPARDAAQHTLALIDEPLLDAKADSLPERLCRHARLCSRRPSRWPASRST